VTAAPPPDVAAAAAVVQKWLDSGQQPPRVTDEQYAKMTPAQRLDYARSFDQSQFLARGTRTT
jgi:hypothetical protein